MKYYVIHFGGILKKQRYIIGHRSHMDFQLLNVQKLRMISIMMKIISITKRVIGKYWKNVHRILYQNLNFSYQNLINILRNMKMTDNLRKNSALYINNMDYSRCNDWWDKRRSFVEENYLMFKNCHLKNSCLNVQFLLHLVWFSAACIL